MSSILSFVALDCCEPLLFPSTLIPSYSYGRSLLSWVHKLIVCSFYVFHVLLFFCFLDSLLVVLGPNIPWWLSRRLTNTIVYFLFDLLCVVITCFLVVSLWPVPVIFLVAVVNMIFLLNLMILCIFINQTIMSRKL